MNSAEPGELRECPACGQMTEPEQDGDLVFYACTEPGCGHEFGYRRVQQQEDACAAGVPLAQLSVLGGLTEAETGRLLHGRKQADGVFLGMPVLREGS